MRRRLVTFLLVLGVVVLPLGTPANAVNGAFCAVKKGSASFSPALTSQLKNRSFTLSAKLTNCVSLESVTKGTLTGSGSGRIACATKGSSAGKFTITWNGGRKSNGSWVKGDTLTTGALWVLQGKIDTGLFAGDAQSDGFEMPLVLSIDSAACDGAGMPKVAFNGQIGVGNIV